MNKKVILCIDDEKIVIDCLKAQLRKGLGSNYLYEFAESAEEGWMVMEELSDEKMQISAVVSDWLMPGMKGDELLVKVHQKYPQSVKILLTGQADEKAINSARNLGKLHACLSKPWNENDLIQTLKSGLK